MSDSPKYDVEIAYSTGTVDGYWWATITRKGDGKQLDMWGSYLWLLKRRVRRKALDRAFGRMDAWEAKQASVAHAEV